MGLLRPPPPTTTTTTSSVFSRGGSRPPSVYVFMLARAILMSSLFHRPAAWKQAAFMQYPRCMNSTQALSTPPFLATGDPCVNLPANQITHMGYSMRTSEWRYAEWPAWKCTGIGGDENICADMHSGSSTGSPSYSWSGSADWDDLAS